MPRTTNSPHAQVLAILNDIGELAAAKQDWRTPLCDHIRALTGAEMGVVGEIEGWDGVTMPKPVRVADTGLSEAARVHFASYLSDPNAYDPFLARITMGPRLPRTLVRRDLVTDDDWYTCRYVVQYRKKANVDDMMVSIVAPRGTHSAFALGAHQSWSKGAFTPRAKQSMALLQQSMQGWSRMLLPPAPVSPVTLTPRLESTLRALSEGNTEGQIAKALQLSEHTVHMHVRRLYKLLGVSSRAQLLRVVISQGLLELAPWNHQSALNAIDAAKPQPDTTSRTRGQQSSSEAALRGKSIKRMRP
jgi:DNA-binding CsgD family transcriptional regulator